MGIENIHQRARDIYDGLVAQYGCARDVRERLICGRYRRPQNERDMGSASCARHRAVSDSGEMCATLAEMFSSAEARNGRA